MVLRELFFRDIRIHKAQTVEDFNKAFNCRLQAYGKYYNFKSIEDVIDEYDYAPNNTLLLAEDKDKNAVGTMRILDGRFGKIELDEFIDVNAVLEKHEKPYAEATRLAIPRKFGSNLAIKLLLNRAYFDYCCINSINSMVMSIQENPKFEKHIQVLTFENVGPAGTYHHTVLGNKKHHTYKGNVNLMYDRFKKSWHPVNYLLCERTKNVDTTGFLLFGVVRDR